MDYKSKQEVIELSHGVSAKLANILTEYDFAGGELHTVGDIMELVKVSNFSDDELFFVVAQYTGLIMQKLGMTTLSK